MISMPVLIVHASGYASAHAVDHSPVGGGYRSTAQAVNAALTAQALDVISHPEHDRLLVTPMLADVLSFGGPLFRTMYGRGYEFTAQHLRRMLRIGRGFGDKPRSVSRRVRFIEWSNAAELGGLLTFIRENNIQVVCCTHFLPATMLASMRREGRFHGRIHVCVTDFQVHGFWMHPDIDRYYVATNDAVERLQEWGVAPERICHSGIPVRPGFCQLARPPFDPDRGLHLLFIAGSCKIGEARTVLNEIASVSSNCDLPVRVTVLTSGNKSLQEALTGWKPVSALRLELRGFELNMPELMASADCVLTRAHGATCAEALCAGLPLLFLSPSLEHDVCNAEILAEKGAGIACFNPGELSHALQLLRENKERWSAMSLACKAFAMPDAARVVAEHLLEDCKTLQRHNR